MEQPRTPGPPRGPGIPHYMMGMQQPGLPGMPFYGGYRPEYDYMNPAAGNLYLPQQAYAAAAAVKAQQQSQAMYPHLQPGFNG